MLMQFGVSIWRRKELVDESGDPWDGRTLEWATSSPPPAYNFAFTPVVHGLDAWNDMKQVGQTRPRTYLPIHMPRNTGDGRDPGGCCDGSAALRWSGTSGGWRRRPSSA